MKLNYISISDNSMASYRYQITTPAKELAKMGHQVIVSSNPLDDIDVYIFHKHLRFEEQDMAKELKKKAKIVFVISDAHFDDNDPWRDHYINMCAIADKVVCATEALAKTIKAFTGINATVIFDPWGVEFEEKQPCYKPNGKLKLMWFGHPSNFNGLFSVLNYLLDNEILVVTSKEVEKIKGLNGYELIPIPYNISNMAKTFEKCDAVIIPQNLNDITKLAKTHNRVVDSFRAGKFVVCSPVDAYLDFKDYAYIGDVVQGVEWLKEQNPKEIEERITKAQEFIRKTFDPKILIKQWEEVLCH